MSTINTINSNMSIFTYSKKRRQSEVPAEGGVGYNREGIEPVGQCAARRLGGQWKAVQATVRLGWRAGCWQGMGSCWPSDPSGVPVPDPHGAEGQPPSRQNAGLSARAERGKKLAPLKKKQGVGLMFGSHRGRLLEQNGTKLRNHFPAKITIFF